MNTSASSSSCGLGLDAGGTATRWLPIDEQGRELGRGEVAGFSATQLGTVQPPRWRPQRARATPTRKRSCTAPA